MGLFDLFARRPALSEGLEQYRNTSGAVLLDVTFGYALEH